MTTETTAAGILQGVLWVEKYRPQTLDRVALEDGNRKVLQNYLEGGEIPHLLLAGPPGTGKTTIARILCKSLDCRVLSLNASSERGIDVVREKIGSFVTAMTSAKWSIVFLDEADYMTAEAQTALRNLIESYAERARFILTANYQHKIIGPLQSRCLLVTLDRPPIKERFRILADILQAEGITSTPQITLSYVEAFPDMRKMLMGAQRAYLANNHILPPARPEESVNGAEIFALVRGKNWTGLRRLTQTGTFDPSQGLRELFWAIPDEDPKVGFLRHVIGKAVHESAFTPDPIIHFLGTCAEAMEGL